MPRFRELMREYLDLREKQEPIGSGKKKNPLIGAPFWPHEVLRDMMIFVFLLAIILFLNAYGPPPLHEPGDPFSTPVPPPLPDWYLLWAYGLIKLSPDIVLFGVTLVTGKILGVLLTGLPFILLAALPFLDKGKAKRPGEARVQAALGVAGIAFIFFVSLFSIKHVIVHYYPQITENILLMMVFGMPLLLGASTWGGLKRKSMKSDYTKELNLCYQCDRCDNACPLHEIYDIPKINLVQSNHVTGGFSHPFLCFTCGKCQAACPQKKKMVPLVRKQRAKVERKARKGLKVKERMVHSHKGIFHKLAVLGSRVKASRPLPKGAHRYGYIPGCIDTLPLMNIDVEHVGIKAASLDLMKRAGLDVVPLDMGCCGHDQLWQGKTKLFNSLRRKNLEYLEACGVDVLVTSCAECYHTLSNHYDLKVPIVHVSELLQGMDFELETPKAPEGKDQPTVIYHDPCRLGRLMEVYNAPRNLINMVPGIKVVEFDENREKALCCAVPAMSNCTPKNKYYRNKKLDEAARKGVDYFVTTCPKCIGHYGCTRGENPQKYGMEIMDLNVFMASCLKGARSEVASSTPSKEDLEEPPVDIEAYVERPKMTAEGGP